MKMNWKKGGAVAGAAVLGTAAAAASAAETAFAMAIKRKERTNEQWEEELDNRWTEHAADMRREMAWFEEQEREEVSIRSRDGLKLCASYLEAPNARACMLLMHGFRSWCRFDFSMVLRFYYEHGLSILLVDQRSHGRSEGKYIGYGILERYDCQQWAWYLHAKLGGRLPIFLDGVSMGASTVMMASELELPASVVGVIGDCGYNSAWEEVAYCMKQRYHLPAFPLLHAVDSLCRRRAGYSLKDTTAAKAIANSRLPLMLLHGTADTTVPVTNAAEIAAAAPFLLEKVIVEGAEHGCSYLNEPARCDEALLRFVEACSANFKGN